MKNRKWLSHPRFFPFGIIELQVFNDRYLLFIYLLPMYDLFLVEFFFYRKKDLKKEIKFLQHFKFQCVCGAGKLFFISQLFHIEPMSE